MPSTAKLRRRRDRVKRRSKNTQWQDLRAEDEDQIDLSYDDNSERGVLIVLVNDVVVLRITNIEHGKLSHNIY